MMRVTLAHIARRAGLSVSTVSLALRNDPRLATRTVQRVQRIAGEIGYRPDPSLSIIAAHRWRGRDGNRGLCIAFIFDSQSPDRSVLRDYMRTAREQLERLGYRMERFDLREYPDGRVLSNILHHRGVRGVVVPSVFNESVYAGFAWERFAGICCGVGYWRPPYHVVTNDVFSAVQLAVQHAVAAGYRRLGAALFLHPRTAEDDARRFGAALFEDDLRSVDGCRIEVLTCEPTDKPAFVAWFRRVRPEAVIALNSDVVNWLEQAGFSVPDEVAVISLAGNSPRLAAGIDPRHERIGQIAADMLDLAIRLNAVGVPSHQRTVLVPAVWQDGPTMRREERAPGVGINGVPGK